MSLLLQTAKILASKIFASFEEAESEILFSADPDDMSIAAEMSGFVKIEQPVGFLDADRYYQLDSLLMFIHNDAKHALLDMDDF